MPKQPALQLGEAFRVLGEGLKTNVTRPNVYGYRPHAKQHKFHSSTAKLRLYIGGNRSGKTVGGIVEDVLWLTGRHPFRPTPKPPVYGRIISVDFINGIEKIIRPELARWLPVSELRGGSWDSAYSKELRTLTLANGSFVEFMSYDQDLDKFAGTSRHFIHFDEEPPKDIFTENLLRTVDVGGEIWITMTPVEGMTWVFEDIYEPGLTHERENTEVIVVDMTENPYLSQGEIQQIIGALDDDDKEARVHGKFIQLGGLIYKHFDPTPGGLHVLERYPEIPKDGIIVASLDHGFNNPTAWLWHYVTPDGGAITFKEHYASGLVVGEHAKIVHDINGEIGRAPDMYVGDPSISQTNAITSTSVLQEYARLGIPIVLGNNDVRAGLNRVASYMRPRPGPDGKQQAMWHITQNCTATISELIKYRWKVYANKRLANQNNLHEEPHKKNDHAADSLRYFIMSQPDLASEYEMRRNKPQPSPNDTYGYPVAADPYKAHLSRVADYEPPDFVKEYNTGEYTDDIMGADW